jgi:S1-C subfamily serine protease
MCDKLETKPIPACETAHSVKNLESVRLITVAAYCRTSDILLLISEERHMPMFKFGDEHVIILPQSSSYRASREGVSSSMRKRFAFARAIVFAGLVIIPLNGLILPPTAIALQQEINSNTSSSQSTNPSSSSNPLSLRTMFKQLENSVVQITSKPPNPQSPNTSTSGSGFVYDNQGHIVTNSHVVGGAVEMDVTFSDGNKYTANVIANDVYNDIAVLQISQNASKPLKPLVLGNSSEVGVGDTVIAIGNPFGLSDTMTTGIVSGIDRSVPYGGYLIPNAIQTDAPISPGNSGGPLLDTRGEMIGMNTAIFSDTNAFSGIGFAIPSNTITKIVPILIEKGYYPHGTYSAMMGAGSAGQSGANVGGVGPHPFCNTGVMTPICK